MFDPTLVVPTGNVVSVFFILVAAFVAGEGWRARLAAIGAGILGIAASALLPTGWLVESPRAAFLVGFAPPVAAAAAVLWVARRRARGAPTADGPS